MTTTALTEGRLGASVLRAARAELTRLRRWPATWITLGAWMLLSLLFGYLFNYLAYATGSTSFATEGATRQSLLAQMMPAGVPDVMVQGLPMFGGALIMVLGAIVAGNGYGWGTWKTILALGVRRGPTVAGSLVGLTAIVVAVLAAALVIDLGVSTLIAATEEQSIVMPGLGELARSFGAGLLVLEMWALIGYLLGTLARGPALAIGLGLVWSLVVENLLRGVGQLLDWVDALTQVLPGTAAGSLVGSLVGTDSGTPGVVDTVPGTQAAITVAIYVVVAAVASILLVRRRDIG